MTAAEREALRLEINRTLRSRAENPWALRLLDIIEVSPDDSQLDDESQGLASCQEVSQ